MTPNPFLGVGFHWLGGLASGSFYVPYRFVKHWAWEVYWLTGGFFSWIIAPWVMGSLLVPDLVAILGEASWRTLWWCYFFGAMWGIGGLTFGLTMRYLGMSLGMAVALGYTAAFGTLVPPIFHGHFYTEVVATREGQVTLFGVLICMVGIAIAGLAGMSKEKEMSDDAKKESIKEFSFKKGILVATFSGIMSACFAFGLDAGAPIRKIALDHGTGELWQGLPVLVAVLLGGFTTNFLWCSGLLVKNRTYSHYYSGTLAVAGTNPGHVRVPMLSNYAFSALAGTTWYMQFFFYTMGESQMGAFKFSSWTLHMASIIIFSSLWGIALREWKGSSGHTRRLLALGLGLLIVSTIIIGYGNYLKTLLPAAGGAAG